MNTNPKTLYNHCPSRICCTNTNPNCHPNSLYLLEIDINPDCNLEFIEFQFERAIGVSINWISNGYSSNNHVGNVWGWKLRLVQIEGAFGAFPMHWHPIHGFAIWMGVDLRMFLRAIGVSIYCLLISWLNYSSNYSNTIRNILEYILFEQYSAWPTGIRIYSNTFLKKI